MTRTSRRRSRNRATAVPAVPAVPNGPKLHPERHQAIDASHGRDGRGTKTERTLAALWAHHHAQMRDPAQIVSQWSAASDVDPALLAYRVTGDWWDILRQHRLTLLATREYEHLVVAFSARDGKPRMSHLPLPHPSGMAIDRERGRVHIASTRNPNVLFEFAPSTGQVVGRAVDERLGRHAAAGPGSLPAGPLYLHDLAMIGGRLHANAVGLNAVVRFDEAGGYEPVWWPRSIDGPEGPRFERNYLQLNSIAAGPTLKSSYFSASTATPSRAAAGASQLRRRRPGRAVFRQDAQRLRRRPDTAAFRATFRGDVWIDNSGYGELGRIVDGRFEPVSEVAGLDRVASASTTGSRSSARVGCCRATPVMRRASIRRMRGRHSRRRHGLGPRRRLDRLAARQSALRDRSGAGRVLRRLSELERAARAVAELA